MNTVRWLITLGSLWQGWRRFLGLRDQAGVDSDLAGLDRNRIPAHVAIIMDGNGRWATRRGLPRLAGHRAGVEALRAVIEAGSKIGVQYLTLYAFSTENWDRPAEEVSGLMDLLVEYLQTRVNELHENGIKLRVIGRIGELSPVIQTEIAKACRLTQNNTKMTVIMALNYGGRAEITDAAKAIVGKALRGELTDPGVIDEAFLDEHLYTASLPDPDLIIRPSGEMRLSNFLLWQSAYAEFWQATVLWPDFRPAHLVQAIRDYQQRDRRFGKINE